MHGAYYNEHDRFAAAWLRELIRDGLIPAGDVDERDIQLVQPADLAGYEQCHFFAGIGGWAYALQLAGWGGPVWTGSCPCQPFSAAGKGAGFDDSRHLWPSWFRLIRECRPPVVFGEQVASADGLAWFDTVSTDLEAEAYAVGAADLAAASVGAPHLRQRLFFVADAKRGGREGGPEPSAGPGAVQPSTLGSSCCTVGHSHGAAQQARGAQPGGTEARSGEPTRPGGDHWAVLKWVWCRDRKWRCVPAESALFPLAARLPNRVGTLRGAGNAIVAAVAAEFIKAFLDCGNA